MAELEFNIDSEVGELDVFPPIPSEKFSEQMQEYLASLHSIRTGITLEQARLEISALGEAGLAGQSRVEATALNDGEARRAVQSAIEVSSIEDITQAENTRAAQQEIIDNTQAPEILSQTQANPGDIWDRISSRTAARIVTLQKKLAAAAPNITLLSGLLDFVDIILSYPFDALVGGGFTRADLAQEIQTLISADIGEEEFNSRIDSVIEQARDSGWFSEENGLMLLGQIENIRQGGIGSEATIDKLGTVLDVATLPALLTSVSKLALKGLTASRNTTSAVAALRGPHAAGDNLAEALAAPGTPQAAAAGIPEHTLPGFVRHPTSGLDSQAWSAPGFDKAAKAERENQFLNIIRGYSFSRRINPKVFDEWVPKGLKILNQELDATSRSNVLSLRVDPDNSGNIFGRILFGRRDGTPFTTKGNATKFANRHGGEIIPVSQGDRQLFVVEQTKNLSTAGLVDPLDVGEIGTHFFREWGSTFLTVPRRLETLAKRGEGVIGRLGKDIAPIFRAATKATPKKERAVVEQIFGELRDGDRLSKTRRALTPAEFRSEFAILNNGVAPSEAAENLYNTIQELNDALYFLKADVRFKEVVDGGGEVFILRGVDADGIATERNIIVSRAGANLDPTTIVYNPVSGVRTPASDLKPNQKIFEVNGGLKVGEEVATHITSEAPELRRVYHTDVLGYNPGGPRSYDFLNYGVGQESVVNIMGKGERPARAKTLMGTATRNEAKLAAQQINNIFEKIRELIPGVTSMSRANALDALRNLGNDPDLLEVLLKNNDWNLEVENVRDLVKVIDDYGLDIRINMGFKAFDDAFATVNSQGVPVFGARAGETQRDAFEGILDSPRNGRRGDDPLVGMGGTQANTISPIDTISRDFVRVSHERAFSAYNFQAVNGWLKGADNFITNKEAIRGLPPRQAMDAAEFGNKPGPEGVSFMRAREGIRRTLGNRSDYEKRWDILMDNIAERVYDKSFKKVGKTLATAQLSKNPLSALRAFAFHAKLGFLAIDQLFVQSSQIFNILGVVDLKAIPAIASNVPLRLTMINTSPEFALEVGRRVGKFIDMDAQEFADFSRFWNESGRGLIGGEVGELNSVSHTMARGFWKKAGDVSRIFFDEGERVPRATAMHVAWKQYRKKFPKLDPFDDHGINWITERQDSLTAAMTRVSAAPWQKGPLSVPLQFMSYTSKMMESLFSDRLLTKNERIRLGLSQLMFWGASGTVFGGPILDYFINSGQIDLTGDEYTALRYGALDWMIGATAGSDTGFGERLSVGEGIWDMWEDFNNEGLFETLGGPAFQTSKDITTDVLTMMGDVARGNTSMVSADIKKILRNASGPNKAYNAWVIYNLGDYVSRNGDVIASGLSNTDALLRLIGAPLQEVSLTYTRKGLFRDQDAFIKEHGQRVAEIMREMQANVRAGDMASAKDQAKLAAAHIAILPVWAQNKMKKFYVPDATSVLIDIINEGRKRNAGNLDILNDEGE